MFQVEVAVVAVMFGLLLSFGWMREGDIRCNKYLKGTGGGLFGGRPYAW